MLIWRAIQYSTGDTNRDSSMAAWVSLALRGRGVPVTELNEDDELPRGSVYVSMARGRSTLERLADRERCGALVVNSTAAVRLCADREQLERRLREAGIDVPGTYQGSGPCWLKRNDAPGDVVFARDAQELEQQQQLYRERGISAWTVSPHVEGRQVKFYGVAGTDFFRTYGADAPALRAQAEHAARVAGLTVYGGDAIVRADGTVCLVDLNDWPSFSPCVVEAADVIAQRVIDMSSER